MMKKLLLFLSLLFYSNFLIAGDVWVNDYFRKNGTYVRGHYRTSPNKTAWDNYTTYPNINPYTGTQGTKYKYNYYSVPKFNYYTPKSYSTDYWDW